MGDHTLSCPPAPPGIPAGLARPSWGFVARALLVVVALFLFLLFYLALLAGALFLLVWAVDPSVASAAPPAHTWGTFALRAGLFLVSALLFAFLLKGLFRRGKDETTGLLEVTEQQQPELFAFLRALCRELGAPVPARVFLSADVNAAVVTRPSLLNLFVAPRKDLLLGLGLVNSLDLLELKAVVAHEMAHFSQRSLRLSGYAWVAYRVLDNMVHVRDRWDNWVIQGFDLPFVSAFAAPLYALVEGLRKLLGWLFRGIDWAHRSLLWEMEYNADLVAVSACGSDAPVHALLRSEFAQTCLKQARQDLALAAESGLLTRDLFFHQDRAAELLRAREGQHLGRPPELPDQGPGQVFPPQPPAPGWVDHPPNHLREANAKRRYWRSPPEDRPAPSLLRDTPALHEELTRCFYRASLGLEADGPLAAPEAVQALVEEERAVGTFSPRYHGFYDNRGLFLQDLGSLLQEADRQGPPPPGELAAALQSLYTDDLSAWVAANRQRLQDLALLEGLCSERELPGEREFDFRGGRRRVADADRLVAAVQAELEEDHRYLAAFDARALTLHYHLAGLLGRQEELRRRYEFHLRLEPLPEALWGPLKQVESVLHFFAGRKTLDPGEAGQALAVLGQARQGLADVLSVAASLSPPALKNAPEGAPLLGGLPAEPSVPDLGAFQLSIDFGWMDALRRQIGATMDKLGRARLKSLAALLAFQEQLVADGARLSC